MLGAGEAAAAAAWTGSEDRAGAACPVECSARSARSADPGGAPVCSPPQAGDPAPLQAPASGSAVGLLWMSRSHPACSAGISPVQLKRAICLTTSGQDAFKLGFQKA